MGKTQYESKQKEKILLKEPDKYVVIMHNDDFTTLDFVVKILKTVFFKQDGEAESIMLAVHSKGSAVVGVYTFDMAKSKCRRAMAMAQEEGFPFKVTYEKEGNNAG